MTRRSQMGVYVPALESVSLPSILGSSRDTEASSDPSDDELARRSLLSGGERVGTRLSPSDPSDGLASSAEFPTNPTRGLSSDPSDDPWHSGIPWYKVQAVYRDLRSTFFSIKRPEGTYFRVYNFGAGRPPTEEMAEQVFGRRSWAPNWEFSYNKRGEIVNLARVVYESGTEPSLWWFQYHLRGWAGPDLSMDLGGHWEPEPTEHPDAHLNEVGFDRTRGMAKIEEVLNEVGAEYEEVTWER